MTNSELTEVLRADTAGIDRAAVLLHAGALVSFPTETVYGLGADARNAAAVRAIFTAKGRPHFNPLIIHVADTLAARGIAEFHPAAEKLAAAFWPGPLTLVLPLRADARLASMVTGGRNSVALRLPAHPVAQALLRAFDGPLAAPSANPSGGISPTSAAHVLDGLGGRIAAVLDGGPCTVGLESTIIGFAASAPVLLRPGGIAQETIEECLGRTVLLAGPESGEAPTAPGQLASHYAPRSRVRLNVRAPQAGETWIGFGPDCAGAAFNLSAAGDLREAAAQLYALLRKADDRAGKNGTIAIAPIPETGLGRAINDRLHRAAAPRD